MKKLIYIAIDDEDSEPILSSMIEQDLLKQLDIYNGLHMGNSEIIENRQIIYDGEYQGNLIRVMKYKSFFKEEECINTYNIWCIEIN